MIPVVDLHGHLQRAPACGALLKAWLDWAKDALIPTADDVRPELIGTLLPHVSVFNVAPDGTMGYSLAGGHHRELMQRDLRGWALMQSTPEGDREERLRRARPILEFPCGMLTEGSLIRESGGRTSYTALVLPIRSDPATLPRKAHLAIDDRDGPRRNADDPVRTVPLADTVRYVDLGYGAPAPI